MSLEVARRWMWVFLRAEAEWGKFLSRLIYQLILIPVVRNDRGPGLDDVLLGEYGGKLDAD